MKIQTYTLLLTETLAISSRSGNFSRLPNLKNYIDIFVTPWLINFEPPLSGLQVREMVAVVPPSPFSMYYTVLPVISMAYLLSEAFEMRGWSKKFHLWIWHFENRSQQLFSCLYLVSMVSIFEVQKSILLPVIDLWIRFFPKFSVDTSSLHNNFF